MELCHRHLESEEIRLLQDTYIEEALLKLQQSGCRDFLCRQYAGFCQRAINLGKEYQTISGAISREDFMNKTKVIAGCLDGVHSAVEAAGRGEGILCPIVAAQLGVLYSELMDLETALGKN